SYAASTGNGDYAGLDATVGVSALADLYTAHLIDSELASGDKSGFTIIGDRTAATNTELATFYFSANPTTPSGLLLSGTKRFGVETSGVIHYDATEALLAVPFDEITVVAALPLEN
ncbi:MAG TPA: hypothetical protein VJV05_01545, partial [Pyrinomonadaceae bacterium]|nr:hypothetical protein [Pyrinomonadaceae bacterium]